MSTATTPHTSVEVVETRQGGWAGTDQHRPPRLMLSASIGRGALDGAWWPHSRDLRTEALGLANHFPPSLGRILRLIYATADWTGGPGRLKADNVFVTLAAFPDRDAHRVLLRTDWGQHVIQLLLIPPEWDPRRAPPRPMRIASTPTNAKSATAILAEANDRLRRTAGALGRRRRALRLPLGPIAPQPWVR